MNRTPLGAFPPSPVMQVDPLNRTPWFSPDGRDRQRDEVTSAAKRGSPRSYPPGRDFLSARESFFWGLHLRQPRCTGAELPQLVKQISRSGVIRPKKPEG